MNYIPLGMRFWIVPVSMQLLDQLLSDVFHKLFHDLLGKFHSSAFIVITNTKHIVEQRILT